MLFIMNNNAVFSVFSYMQHTTGNIRLRYVLTIGNPLFGLRMLIEFK